MKKVYVEVTTRLIINMDEDETVDNVIQEMDYNFEASADTGADIVDSEIRTFEIKDSK